jgi:hypothetical protein
MKPFFILFLGFLALASCKSSQYGQKFDETGAITAKELKQKIASLGAGETVSATVQGKIAAVCQARGCWMNLDMEDGTVMMVRMKDHAFFVPKDAAGRTAVVKGEGYIEETSVEMLKHFAEDAGKSQQEIDAITKPKQEFVFRAEGVVIK